MRSLSFLLVACTGPFLLIACTPVTAPVPAVAAPTRVTTSAPAAVAPEAAPKPSLTREALARLFAREMPRMQAAHVKSEDGAFEADVETTGTPTTRAPQGDEPLALDVPIGTESSVRCNIQRGRVVVGGALHELLGGLEKNGIRILDARITAVAMAGARPVVLTEFEYDAAGQSGRARGLLKYALAPGQDSSLLCFHDEVGYRATFQRVVTGVVSSVKRGPAELGGPLFYSVHAARTGDSPTGITEMEVYPRDGGGHVTFTYFSRFEANGTHRAASDGLEVEATDAEGHLLSSTSTIVADGETTTSLEMTRTTRGRYHVRGTHDGTAVDQSFSAKVELTNHVAQRRALARIGKQKGATLTMSVYSPLGTLLGPTEDRCVSRGGGEFEITSGDFASLETFDADGLRQEARLEGPTPWISARIFSKGKL